MLAEAAMLGWARFFVTTPAGPRVAHSAVLLDAGRRRLRFHLANKNDAIAGLTAGPVLALFEGPHAYVSASWYPAPAVNVPTWNYLAIECTGTVAPLDRAALVELLDSLAAAHEDPGGWSRAMMEPSRFEAMLGAITAYEMTIETIRGTRKLSQNKSSADQAALADGLERSGAIEMAALMRGAA
jgi:transcriptional regulator